MMSKERKMKLRDEIDLPSTTYATFSLYPYPAKFIPHIPAYVFKKYAKPRMKVFDPFAGYGTAGIVARIYDCDYELWDLNPMLEYIHRVSILEPKTVNIEQIITNFKKSTKMFKPDWSNLKYWYHINFLQFLYKVWGYYHSLEENYLKNILTIPLLRITRYYSYDDEGRQKLSRSNKSKERVKKLLIIDWENNFFKMLKNEINKLIIGLCEYQKLHPKKVQSIIKGGVDTFYETLEEEKDILITSPPYLQSQEYVRHAKNDLYWLNYKEKHIQYLTKLEIPYRDTKKVPVKSDTYFRRRNIIKEKRFKDLYDNYFWGVLGSLERLSEKVTKYLFIFVGRASLRGEPVKIDQIFAEHFSSIGWNHDITIEDKINSRRMFRYKENPATGIKDKRTKSEYLIVLRR